MKSTPIIMQAHNVLAIAEGRKTQTRRVMKPQPSDGFDPSVQMYHPTKVARDGEEYPGDPVFGVTDKHEPEAYRCPYGKPGDELWVKEPLLHRDRRVHQYSDGQECDSWGCGDPLLKPRDYSPMFMPKWASRLTLTLTNVRVERLSCITDDDARAEGCVDRVDFRMLWSRINGTESLMEDPFVWCLTFTVKENRVKAATEGTR